MARSGRPTVEIDLSADEHETLKRWARRHSSSQALALRCRIVLACAEGDRTHTEIAADLGCNPMTVSKWRHRFAADRLDGLVDAPRPGAERKISDETVEAVVVDTLETTEHTCLTLVWAVIDRASAGWRGVTTTPAINAQLTRLRVDLYTTNTRPDNKPADVVTHAA